MKVTVEGATANPLVIDIADQTAAGITVRTATLNAAAVAAWKNSGRFLAFVRGLLVTGIDDSQPNALAVLNPAGKVILREQFAAITPFTDQTGQGS